MHYQETIVYIFTGEVTTQKPNILWVLNMKISFIILEKLSPIIIDTR